MTEKYHDPDTLPDGKVVQVTMPLRMAEVVFLCGLMESQVEQAQRRGELDPNYRTRIESLKLRLRQAGEAARVLAAREIEESKKEMAEEMTATLTKALEGKGNRFQLGRVRVVPYDPEKDAAARAQYEGQQKDEEKH